MTARCDLFFPPGTRVLTLPNWHNPRLYLPERLFLQRWEDSSFYPAFRKLARVYRLSLRIKAAMGLGEVRQVRSDNWPLGEFVQDIFPLTASVVVLVGTPGPAQKITAQLREENGRVLGYLKYAEKVEARKRLRQERKMLSNLPDGAGPILLRYGTLGDGDGLLTTPLVGKALPATLPPEAGLSEFSSSLVVSPPVPVSVHPWFRHAREQGMPELDAWLEPLAGKEWPVTIQHGDFAPWNTLRRPDGTLGAIDWEYGALEGFPYLDLAYYVLQTAALIYHWSPPKAAQYAAEYLAGQQRFALSRAEGRALTSLAAYDAYRKFQEDGHATDIAHLQRWRAIWEASV
jgi:hypothetical protein